VQGAPSAHAPRAASGVVASLRHRMSFPTRSGALASVDPSSDEASAVASSPTGAVVLGEIAREDRAPAEVSERNEGRDEHRACPLAQSLHAPRRPREVSSFLSHSLSEATHKHVRRTTSAPTAPFLLDVRATLELIAESPGLNGQS